MKKLILLCACLLALTSPLRVAAGPPEIVVVRIQETYGGVTAIITRGEGKSEKVEFDKGGTDKRLTQSSEGYYKLFQTLYQQGFTLQSTFTTPGGTSVSGSVTLLFVKAP